MDKYVEQDDGRKGRVNMQNSKTGLEKNDHACIVEGVLIPVSDSTAMQYLNLTCLTQTNQC